ncbi:MAG TPA: LysE family transporter [Flavobacterium sp.]|jgi:threonine/homoserine/homoserine lactone efflux protein|uniref:LysE family translocator n=1 Tax=Flavobacterium sp. TaxID=239 RepID=UPI002CA1C9A5|nr:LysE family transporter [Flavobacterium sp.]HPW98676.1 LysE family transporter [Flavobacterium sp.]HQA73893.1 LysE family transporter [Flavobacterium sp.]
MTFIIPFFSGFLAAIVGIFPPGLINMTAAKVSVTDGRRRALVFVFGALIVIFIQTYISVLFAQYINKNIEIVILLREIGLAIFTLLSLYFLFFAKEPKPILNKNKIQLKSKRSRFFMGMLISAINFFPIPYYVLVSITLASYKVFTFTNLSIYSLVSGVVIGSFSVFYCYVVFFEKLKTKTDYFIKNMNSIIGIITGIVAVITLINVLDYYY